MDCKEIRNNLIFLIEKEISPDKEKELSVHLENCLECSVLYKNILRTYDNLDIKEEIEPKAFFAESVLNKLDTAEESRIDNSSLLERFFLEYFKKIAISGIAIIVLIIVFFYITEGTFLFNYFADSDDLTTEYVTTIFLDN